MITDLDVNLLEIREEQKQRIRNGPKFKQEQGETEKEYQYRVLRWQLHARRFLKFINGVINEKGEKNVSK